MPAVLCAIFFVKEENDAGLHQYMSCPINNSWASVFPETDLQVSENTNAAIKNSSQTFNK